ncbi:RtcB family protein [Butyrivibrio sp. MC2013]|uniref:RtcB family protein n=1 Tax=Butyrivibrio sp. MC2013 TaxID=1280686 RepID=UPI0018C9AF57
MCMGDIADGNASQYAIAQVQMICDTEAVKGSNIVVMPDVHPGKVGPIGLTMTVTDAVLPALIGIDIGCGMSMVKIGKIRKDFQKLDTVIRDNVPVGFKVRSTVHRDALDFDLGRLNCFKHIRDDKALLGIGTLGGGNHFIELDADENGEGYLIIHSGSRHLGKEVAEYYMDKGHKYLMEHGKEGVPYELTYLTDELLSDYLHDIQVVQEYAELNRHIIMKEICKGMKWKVTDEKSCIHNYIEETTGAAILRKGAISAKENQEVIIPINMRDGVILGIGKGNDEWNSSAPHGAGRISSREKVSTSHTVSEFKASMKGIYTSCISKDTLDEAPFAYRDIDYIREAVKETVEITKLLKPVYNYKGGNA